MKGQLGPFTVDQDKISGGLISTDTSFEIQNNNNEILIKTFKALSNCIINAWYSGDLNHKKLVLVKLNGEKITIPGKDGQGNEVYISAHR